MAKSRKNNRFSNRNRRSKCRKHNIQRGGEITYVKALRDYVDDSKYGNISKGDIILEISNKDGWASGYNVTQGCVPVQYEYPTTNVTAHTATDTEHENGNKCSRGERVQNYSINKGFCGKKRSSFGGRDNCVVITSISTKNKNKVVLYVHPKDTIKVRYFENHDDIKYTDQKVLTDEIIQEIITKLGIVGSVREVKPNLKAYISAHKAEIYKGENMLSILSNL